MTNGLHGRDNSATWVGPTHVMKNLKEMKGRSRVYYPTVEKKGDKKYGSTSLLRPFNPAADQLVKYSSPYHAELPRPFPWTPTKEWPWRRFSSSWFPLLFFFLFCLRFPRSQADHLPPSIFHTLSDSPISSLSPRGTLNRERECCSPFIIRGITTCFILIQRPLRKNTRILWALSPSSLWSEKWVMFGWWKSQILSLTEDQRCWLTLSTPWLCFSRSASGTGLWIWAPLTTLWPRKMVRKTRN